MQDWVPSVTALVGRVLLSHKAAVQAPLLSIWEPFEMVTRSKQSFQSLSGQVVSH